MLPGPLGRLPPPALGERPPPAAIQGVGGVSGDRCSDRSRRDLGCAARSRRALGVSTTPTSAHHAGPGRRRQGGRAELVAQATDFLGTRSSGKQPANLVN